MPSFCAFTNNPLSYPIVVLQPVLAAVSSPAGGDGVTLCGSVQKQRCRGCSHGGHVVDCVVEEEGRPCSVPQQDRTAQPGHQNVDNPSQYDGQQRAFRDGCLRVLAERRQKVRSVRKQTSALCFAGVPWLTVRGDTISNTNNPVSTLSTLSDRMPCDSKWSTTSLMVFVKFSTNRFVCISAKVYT